MFGEDLVYGDTDSYYFKGDTDSNYFKIISKILGLRLRSQIQKLRLGSKIRTLQRLREPKSRLKKFRRRRRFYDLINPIQPKISPPKVRVGKKQIKLNRLLEKAEIIAKNGQHSKISTIDRLALKYECLARKLVNKMENTRILQQIFFQIDDLVFHSSSYLDTETLRNMIVVNRTFRETIQESQQCPIELYTINRFLQSHKPYIQSIFLEPLQNHLFDKTYTQMTELAKRRKIPIIYESYEYFLNNYETFRGLILPQINYTPRGIRLIPRMFRGIDRYNEVYQSGNIRRFIFPPIVLRPHERSNHEFYNATRMIFGVNASRSVITSDCNFDQSEICIPVIDINRPPMKFQYQKPIRQPKIRNFHFTKVRK
jgi:hypothetical protein